MTPEFDVIVVTTDLQALRGMSGLAENLNRTLSDREYSLRVTWVVNGDPSGGLVTFFKSRVLYVGENAGWVRAANAGLSLATAPHVVLMNDDVTVETDDWLTKLREPLLSDPKIAAVGPRSTPNQGRQGDLNRGRDLTPRSHSWRYCREALEVGADAVGIHDFNPDHEWGIGSWPLSFFCVMVSQEAFRDVGLLDLNLADGYGGDDDDWQRRAWEAGWKFAYQPGVMVAHAGNQTFRERKAELQPRNLEYLRRKHGRA